MDRSIELDTTRRTATTVAEHPNRHAVEHHRMIVEAITHTPNLYNERPTWLDADRSDPAISDNDLLAALLTLNLERAAVEVAHP